MKTTYFITAVFGITSLLLCILSHELYIRSYKLGKQLEAEIEKNTELQNQYQVFISSIQSSESKKDESTKQIEYLSNDFTCTAIPDDVAKWLREL